MTEAEIIKKILVYDRLILFPRKIYLIQATLGPPDARG